MSNVPKSTPGPWKVSDSIQPLAGQPWQEIESALESIALVYVNQHEACIANARLIAAAPELAEALREMYYLEDTGGHRLYGDRSLRAMSRAAILLERVGY